MYIKNKNLNAIQLAPGLKFIGNLPHGWQPYLNFRMLWNIIDETKVRAAYVNLPETSVKPYFEYGLGVQKTVGERFTGFGQAMFRGGGRSGVSFTFGGRVALGELKDKNEKMAKRLSERRVEKTGRVSRHSLHTSDNTLEIRTLNQESGGLVER